MVQARQSKTCFQGLEEREMSIKLRARNPVDTVVGVHDRQHLVDIRRGALVVFIPQYDDGIAALLPGA